MFEASKGFRINADVNGSYNFLRKIAERTIKNKIKFDYVYPKFNVFDIMEGVVVQGLVPKRLSLRFDDKKLSQFGNELLVERPIILTISNVNIF